MYFQSLRLLLIATLLATATQTASADPCGMVPPIFTGNTSPITRIGLQKTYVFYKDGVESFVIRPGFQGNVDNFGMLIPFPTPPELRKVPDNVFDHVVKAVDPPEVLVDLRIRMHRMRRMKSDAPMATAEGLAFADSKSQVVVLKQEAVGMYQVAVLAAGSAEALKKWMEKNGYQYPDGMDKVTNEYVEEGWCFVAVKTKVGSKSNVSPRPGQRKVSPEIPNGSTFDGHVQGMGFRFKTDELVVPMRLSAFNGGDTRNVVYLLTDGPRKVQAIPEEFVQRQISGKQLKDNMTLPLPLRIIGGTEADIPKWQRENLPKRRDPAPHNALAKDLFSSDMLAVSSGNLSLEHEEQEKELLRIGEHFGLRGGEIDAVNATALSDTRELATKQGLEQLEQMTLTVVDGDFPREVIAKQNLKFAEYKMPNNRNSNLKYDANQFGPGQKKQGILKVGLIDWNEVDRQVAAEQQRKLNRQQSRVLMGSVASLIGLGLLGSFFIRRRVTSIGAAIVLAGTVALIASPANAIPMQDANEAAVQQPDAKAPMHDKKTYTTMQKLPTSPDKMLEMLVDSKTAETAIAAIDQHCKKDDDQREAMVKRLLGIVKTGKKLPARGWAIAALAEVGGQDVDEYLLNVHADKKQDMVVRTWSAAARVSMTRTTNGLIEKANLINQFPALGRPIGIRLVEKMAGKDEEVDVAKVLEVSMNVPQLRTALAPTIIGFGPEKLLDAMYETKNDNIRRQATGYMGSIANQGKSTEVAELVSTKLKFDPAAEKAPWDGGALFIPGIQWGKEEGRELVGQLIRWHLWCDIKGDTGGQRQIHNNIRGVGLARAAGYQTPGWNDTGTVTWLEKWGEAVGHDEIETILKEQKAAKIAKYKGVLDGLK